MKTNNIFRYAAVLFAAIAMTASCVDPIDNGDNNGTNGENVAPTFPELVENYEVAPGATLSLTFTPNYNWEISVPSETFKYFWIVDGSFKLDKVSGQASETPVTVSIGVSPEEEFDNNRSCDVTLTMNGESKVVAKYMRPAKTRSISVYSAQVDAEGNLQVAEDGVSYVYGTSEATSAALVWSHSTGDFRLPVKVDANCEWDIAVPEWLSVEKPEKTTGTVELILSGESYEAASGKVAFKVNDETLKEFDVTIPSCQGVEVYTATMTDGEFDYDADGYVWSEKAVSEVTLAWLGLDFRMPVKVSSKCNWTIETPEWITVELPEKQAGEVSLTLMGVSTKYPLEDAEGKVKFMYGDKVLHEITVNIPGCKDIMTYTIDMSLTELNYNAAGWISTTTGYEDIKATARVFGTKDVKVMAVETTGGKVGSAPSWFKITMSNYVTATGSDVLQERDVTFEIEENTGYLERSAALFFLAPGVSADVEKMFNADATVKDEYVAYHVPVHQLSSVYTDYLDESSVEDGTEYTFVSADDSKKSELTAQLGETEHVYVLTYNAEYSKVWMNMAVPFASYKVFDADMTSEKSSDDTFWLQVTGVNDTKTNGAFTMYMNMDLPTVASTGYVVFYDKEGVVLAIVECVSPFKEEEVVVPPTDSDEDNTDEDNTDEDITDEYGNVYFENSSYFTDPVAAEAAGIKMYELKEGYYYDRYKSHNTNEHKCALLILEYPSADVEAELTLTSAIKVWSVYPMTWAYNGYVKVNNDVYGNSSGILRLATNKVTIQMSEFIAENMDLVEAITKDKDAGCPILLNNAQDQDPEFVIYCRIRVAK